MENKRNKKKGLNTIVGIIVGVVVSILVKQFLFTTPSFDKVLSEVASKLNKTCPIMVDKETRLDNSVALPNKTLQYNYSLINIIKDSVDIKMFNEIMKSELLKNVKNNPQLKFLKDKEVILSYNYRDKDGKFISLISITPKQYRSK